MTDWTIKITPNTAGNPPGKLADAEIHFKTCPHCDETNPARHRYPECECSALAGLKLIGFAIWERRGRGANRNVTFPARQYSVNGERRSFALLRPIVDATAQNRIRDLVLDAYQEYEERDIKQTITDLREFTAPPQTTRARETAPATTQPQPAPALPLAGGTPRFDALNVTQERAADLAAQTDAARGINVPATVDRRPLHMQNVPPQRRITF